MKPEENHLTQKKNANLQTCKVIEGCHLICNCNTTANASLITTTTTAAADIRRKFISIKKRIAVPLLFFRSALLSLLFFFYSSPFFSCFFFHLSLSLLPSVLYEREEKYLLRHIHTQSNRFSLIM